MDVKDQNTVAVDSIEQLEWIAHERDDTEVCRTFKQASAFGLFFDSGDPFPDAQFQARLKREIAEIRV
jgi:hypothetical protein